MTGSSERPLFVRCLVLFLRSVVLVVVVLVEEQWTTKGGGKVMKEAQESVGSRIDSAPGVNQRHESTQEEEWGRNGGGGLDVLPSSLAEKAGGDTDKVPG